MPGDFLTSVVNSKESDQQSEAFISPHVTLVALWASTVPVPPMKEPKGLPEGDRLW